MIAAGGLLAGSTVLGLLPTMAGASSHREAPLIASDPAVDNTDVYAFSSPENPDNVAFVANWIPFEEPNGGPNFYPWSDDAEYLINIDNDGDAVADLIYRWRFTTDDRRGTDTFLYNNGPVTSLDDENLLFRQNFTLDVSTDGGATYGSPVAEGPVAPSFTGPASMGSSQDYVDNLRTPAITEVGGGGRTLTTQAEDSFFLDLRIFDLLYGGDLSERGVDTLAGYNVNSIVLEVPKTEVAIDGNAADNPVIGVWSTTTRPTLRDADGTAADANTGFTQVSRLGNPLVNEVVVPTGLKDAFNAIPPAQDAEAADGAVVDRVLNPEVPALIEAIYGVPAPATPRWDLFEVFLTGVVSTETYDIDQDPATANPIDVDLNSQTINAGGVSNEEFQPSEMLRLNMSITGPTGLDMKPLHEASRLGVIGGDIQGFPNGRRLADDVVDIELLALEGIYDASNPGDRQAAFDALKEGDKVNSNDNAFSASFPYIAGPNTQAVNKGGGTGAGGTDMPPGNGTPGKPMVPAASGGGSDQGSTGGKPAAQPQVAKPAAQPQANGYPRGGVETGAGGIEDTLLPVLTGSAALLLIGAGAGSLIRGRALRRATSGMPEA
ncbi:DUF4331 domain-containing protein [Blastococcus saxobsidens]|uniref:Uncharacterized protein DUF4331 n=1 Tax=Blastococcus saxobsidens TaxID=138336 RepID=A0A4Q7YCI2_9ACTN|nr:DUF4331 domain-containing protein [Blastococcus saxobsidens]RZU33981.1 uncharacterized protein DUF4331 [Blastococcus saxobsidens]